MGQGQCVVVACACPVPMPRRRSVISLPLGVRLKGVKGSRFGKYHEKPATCHAINAKQHDCLLLPCKPRKQVQLGFELYRFQTKYADTLHNQTSNRFFLADMYIPFTNAQKQENTMYYLGKNPPGRTTRSEW